LSLSLLLTATDDGRLLRRRIAAASSVGRRQAGDRLDDEHDHVGFGDGDPRLVLDARFDGVARVDLEAAVSTSMNRRPFQSAMPYSRSRVVRARSSTIAARWPTIRLNRVDFPTLGRPTMATIGTRRPCLPPA
jgi:hypothetical protein